MAEQDRGVTGLLNFLHNMFIAAWAAVSTVAYGTVTLCIAPFSNRLARYIAHRWCIHLMALCGIRVRAVGVEKLDTGGRYVFIANHQSYFDIPVLYAGLPFSLSFIAKKELFFIPFFGWGIAAIGHIWIDRENARAARKSITRAIGKLKRQGISLVLFPEGTRSVSGDVGEFKRGSFTLALEAGVPVVPVTIRGTRDILPKRSGRFRPGTATLVIGDPIPPAQFEELDKTKLSELVRGRIIAGASKSIS
ncbi:MAG TPA: lysophospholipid acyltransferase family protein [Chitinivibrionales bacterium]|nr:lysophospholipid acyltransferase family protein [Chitinivibrionales bacterium]